MKIKNFKNFLFKGDSIHKNFLLHFSKKLFNQPVVKADAQGGQVGTPVEKKSPIDNWIHLNNLNPNELGLLEIRENLERKYKYLKLDRASNFDWELPKSLAPLGVEFECVNNMEALIEFVKNYNGLLDSQQIFKNFFIISQFQDYNREIFTVLLPVLKNYMKKFDRHNINELYFGVMGAAELNIADTEFWGIFEAKIVNEKLFKYLSLKQIVNLAVKLHEAERISIVLAKILELEIIKQRKALHLQPKLLKLAKKIYIGDQSKPQSLQIKAKSSDVLIAALEDPHIEVTNLSNPEKLH